MQSNRLLFDMVLYRYRAGIPCISVQQTGICFTLYELFYTHHNALTGGIAGINLDRETGIIPRIQPTDK